MDTQGMPDLVSPTGTRWYALALGAALLTLIVTGAVLLGDGPRHEQLLFAMLSSLTAILALVSWADGRKRRAEQLAGLMAVIRRLGRMEFSQLPGNSLHSFILAEQTRLGHAFADTTSRLRRQYSRLQAVLDMDRWMLSVTAADEMLRGVLPLISEVLQCRSVSVVLLDEYAADCARCVEFLAESPNPMAAPRLISIDAAQLRAAALHTDGAHSIGLDASAVGVDAESFLNPLAAAGAQAFRLCPIEFNEQVRGFLCVGFRVDAHAQEDTAIGANEIAERLGLALARRNYARDVHRATEAQAVPSDSLARPRSPLESGLQRALKREEFALVYQPIISAHSRHVGAVEALVRWPNGADGTTRSAAEFIPVAEESGLIVDLGDWVLRTACAQFDSWRRSGLTLDYIAVNVSARQLRHDGLLATVLACLQRSNMQPGQLQLEITEGMLQEGPEAVALLRQLTQRGVRLALDDFGDGNSSLSVVRDLPITALKIDRSCVESLVRAVIGMGAATGKIVIAEGVEVLGQLEFLEAAGVDALQGYLFAPALAAAELPAFVHAQVEAPSLVA